MANDDYHEMELSRRSIQISDMKQDLDEKKDREADAQERLAQLERQISKKKVHIDICKGNAQEMADKAAAEEAFCLQNNRLMQQDEEAAQLEAKVLRETLAKTTRSLEQAQADAVQAQKAAEAANAEAKRQAEETARGAAQLAELEATVATAAADVESIQEKIRALEVTLQMEKQTAKELDESVKNEEEKQQRTQLECDRLSHLLESLSSRGKKEELSKALAAVQKEHLQLTQELAMKQKDMLIKKQDIQGRLDETRRIQKEQTVAPDVATNGASQGALTALAAALEEEKQKADRAKGTRLQLEADAKALEKELKELQGSAMREEHVKQEDQQSASLEELKTAQEKLEMIKRQLREKDEAIQIGRQELAQNRQQARNSVEVLRAKLKDLWNAIGQN